MARSGIPAIRLVEPAPEWQLLPVAAGDVRGYWSDLEPDLAYVARKIKAEWCPGDIYTALLLRPQAVQLYFAFIHGQRVASLILSLDDDILTGHRSLTIFITRVTDRRAVEWGLRDIEQIARERGITRIGFHSPRPGWSKRAKDLGFRLYQQTFVKDI